MSARHFPPTPQPWEVTPADVRPSARDLWRDLLFYVPAWERGGIKPQDIVSGRVGEADDWGGDGGRLWTPDTERGHVLTADDATTQDIGFKWAELVPTRVVTCAILYRKTDTTARKTGAFGVSDAAGGSHRCGSHLPFSDGTVYWDFGGIGTGQRLTYTWDSDLGIDTDWHLWVFQQAPWYRGIWLDAVEKKSDDSGNARSKTDNTAEFMLFRHYTRASDLAQIGMFGMWNRVLRPSEIEQLTADPHAPVRRTVRVTVSALGSQAPNLEPDDLRSETRLDQASVADAALEPDDLRSETRLGEAELATLNLDPAGLRSETRLDATSTILVLEPEDLRSETRLDGTAPSLAPSDLRSSTRLDSIALRRPVDSDAQGELDKATGVAVAHVLEIHYEEAGTDKVLRLTTASRDLDVTVEGSEQTFTATPTNVLRIGTVEVSSDMAAQGVELTLGGVDRTFISLVMADDVHFRGRLVKMWRVYLDPDAGTVSAVVPSSENGWLFHINDRIEFNEDWGGIGEPGTVTVTTRIVSRLAVLQQPTPVMTNMDSHNEMLERAGVLDVDGTRDEFFRRLPPIVGKRFRWGDNYPGA